MRPVLLAVPQSLTSASSVSKDDLALPGPSSSGVLDSCADYEGSEDKDVEDYKDLNPSQRRQAKNRAAQRRFRDRQKGRSQTLETLLALTTAELQQVKSKQQPLEARNSLLESLIGAVAAKQQAVAAPVKYCIGDAEDLHGYCKARGYTAGPDSVVNVSTAGPAIVVSVWGQAQPMTLEQIGALNQQQFAHLYSEYARQLGVCLLQSEPEDGQCDPSSGSSLIQKRLEQLVTEFQGLMISLNLSNPELLKWCHASQMDGATDRAPHPPSFWADLLPVLQYTDSQISDLMCLRRYLYGKLGQLARERRAVLTKMTWNQVDSCHPSDKLSKLSTWAEQLQKNGAEEYRTYMQWAIAVFRGITTCRQGAIGIVYAYPLTNRNIQICEALATLKDEPSVQELLEDTTVSDAQHVTNWEQVVKFAKGVKPEQIPYYNKFVGRSVGDLQLTHAGC